MRTCKIAVPRIAPLCGSENSRWPSKQILAFRIASVPVIFEGTVETGSFKQSLVRCLRPGSLQLAPSRMGCVPTLEQTVGAAPSALSQLTLLQRRIYLPFSFVQTRGQRPWQLTGQSQGVLEPARKGKQRNLLPTCPYSCPQRSSQICTFQMPAPCSTPKCG